MNLGPTELIIILVILLLLFGAKKLPDLANSMGKSIREFRKGSEDGDTESSRATSTSAGSDDKEA